MLLSAGMHEGQQGWGVGRSVVREQTNRPGACWVVGPLGAGLIWRGWLLGPIGPTKMGQ